MKKEEINIDKAIREKLESFTVQPPHYIWENIKGKMAASQKKKRMFFISRIAAAAVVVLAFMAGWYFNDKANTIVPITVEKEVTGTEKQTLVDDPKKEISLAKAQNEQLSVSEDLQQKSVAGENSSFKLNILENKEKSTGNLFTESAERFNIKKLDRIDFHFTKEQQKTLLAKNTFRKTTEIYSEPEEKQIAENLRQLNRTTDNGSGWKMGVNLSPGYSSHTANHSENYEQNMTFSGQNGTGNVGGGFSIQYKTGKKWSVESGVYYAQNGQQSNSSLELFALSSDAGFALSAPEKSYQNTAVNLVDGQVAMNSIAGVIEFSGTPKGVEISGNLESTKRDFSNTLLSQGDFSQIFDFIEIPLFLRYSIIDSKFDVELMGGISAGVLVGNNAFIENEFGLQNIGKTKDISSMNLSGTVGVGLNYALGKHISLAVEPRLNYYLNSINQNPAVNYRPYRIGVFTGLYYEF